MTDPSPAAVRDPASQVAGPIADRILTLVALMWCVLEAGCLLIGLIILVYLLLGTGSGAFVQGVIGNLQVLIAAVTPQALIGLAIVVAITRILGPR